MELDYIDFHRPPLRWPSHCLAAIATDWHHVYKDLLRLNINKENKLIYWQGLLDDVVDIQLGSSIPPREEAMVLKERQRLKQGSPVFSGLILDTEGHVRCSPGETIPSSALREQMDWLVKGVEVLESR